ncbi:MAG: hypothetical protein GY805_07195 [Chloroflexi bacterium]|nr:hypothetical protein [Chloroflexota bacterium]
MEIITETAVYYSSFKFQAWFGAMFRHWFSLFPNRIIPSQTYLQRCFYQQKTMPFWEFFLAKRPLPKKFTKD